jgi:radical SAM protein (TIGR01212 family)
MRYLSFSSHLKKIFGRRVIRISVDAGFTCPNRDGKKGTGGCIYCNNLAFTGKTADRRLSVEEQVRNATENRDELFLVYFQPYTNTYSSPSFLEKLFTDVLKIKNVVGIAIGTRPDCIDEDILRVIEKLNRMTYLWVELGLQSASDRTLELINRKHSVKDFIECVERLKKIEVKTCAHIIIGLPGENREDFLRTGALLSELRVEGVKFHNIQVLKDTKLEEIYKKGDFKPIEMEEYVNSVVDILEILPETTVIHRLAGEADPKWLIAPEWAFSKWKILSEIKKELERRDTWQGKRIGAFHTFI